MSTTITLSALERAEESLTALQEKFLRQQGWQSMCATFGWYWTWEKTTPKGTKLVALDRAEALRMERAIAELATCGREP